MTCESDAAEAPNGSGIDRVVFGLGNPGRKYRGTRHNLGFLVVERLESRFGLTPDAGRGEYLVSRAETDGLRLHLVRPTTYMNLSGRAVAQFLEQEEPPNAPWLVVVDDVALPLGRLRLRARGSHGGHNGLRSVEQSMRTTDYPRLRLGCGPAPSDDDLADFVLGEFAEEEREAVEELVDRAADAALSWAREGTEWTMSRFNG